VALTSAFFYPVILALFFGGNACEDGGVAHQTHVQRNVRSDGGEGCQEGGHNEQADHSFSSPLPARASYVIASGNVRPCAVCDAFFQETRGRCRMGRSTPYRSATSGGVAGWRQRDIDRKNGLALTFEFCSKIKEEEQNPPLTRKEKSGEEVSLGNKRRTTSLSRPLREAARDLE